MDERTAPLDRRTLLRGAVLTGGALVATGLTGCGGDDSTSAGATTGGPTSSAPGTSQAPSTAGPTKAGPDRSVAGLGPASEVEVGGGVIYADEQVVVTQPTAGEFKAFDTTCTHQGCPVTSIEAGEIECPCHFSRYSIADGSVVSGPAPAPLETVSVSVRDGQIVVD